MKLAQKRNQFARKRSSGNFFVLNRHPPSMLQSEKAGLAGYVFLDGEETKSEDCQRDEQQIKLELWPQVQVEVNVTFVANTPCDGCLALLSHR